MIGRRIGGWAMLLGLLAGMAAAVRAGEEAAAPEDARPTMSLSLGRGATGTVTVPADLKVVRGGLGNALPFNIQVTPADGKADWQLLVSGGVDRRFKPDTPPGEVADILRAMMQMSFNQTMRADAVEKDFAPKPLDQGGRIGFYYTVTDKKWVGKDTLPPGQWRYATSVYFRLGTATLIATGLSNTKEDALIGRWLDFLQDDLAFVPAPDKAAKQ